MPRFLSIALALAAPAVVGAADAVSVGRVPLVHTAQMLPLNKFGQLVGEADAAKQADAALGEATTAVRESAGGDARVVKVNVVAVDDDAAAKAVDAVRKRFTADAQPAVSVVVGKLERDGALVAVDVVAAATKAEERVRPVVVEGLQPCHGPHAGVLPAGPRFYVSGQAEKGDDPVKATAATLAGLLKTLDWLGGKPADVVQAKCFLKPVAAAERVAGEFARVFGESKVPLVFVEWESATPVEIELIAMAPKREGEEGPVQYLTPPGMTASPVYSRVTRVSGDGTVFIGGLHAAKAGTAEEEVLGAFDRLKGVLADAGTDFHHLAKATYYVSNDQSSKKLNELRPRFYDPKRPPAASKALVAGVGRKERTITLDMIAVPAPKK